VIRKATATVLVSDEAIVDGGLGTPEDQAAAAGRIEARAAEAHLRWTELPLRRRLRIRVASRVRRWKS
jgi:hypothetical protein